MFLFGGKTAEGKHLNDLWSYSIKDNTWTKIDYKGESLKGRSGHSMINYKDRLYLFGGKTGAIHEINEMLYYDIRNSEFCLIHDSLLEQYTEKELNQINEMKATVNEDKKKKEKSNVKNSTSKKELKASLKKEGSQTQRKSNYGTGFVNKQKYEEELLQSPNTKAMKNSLIYKMENADSKEIRSKLSYLSSRNKTLKLSKIFGSVPMPRDGHSCKLYYDSMIIFGGDRNKFPLNDLFVFHLEKKTK